MRALTISIVLVVAGCAPVPHAEGAPSAASPAPSTTPEKTFAAAAAPLAQQLAAKLLAALKQARASGDTAGALSVCRQIAPTVAAELSTGGFSLRRIGTRVRNTATNTPTSGQARVLAGLTREQPVFVGELDGTMTWMRAIFIPGTACLGCHGSAEQLDPTVRARLTELYPDDAATDYAVGDLRGAFVVTQ